jgi:hypothetical protein
MTSPTYRGLIARARCGDAMRGDASTLNAFD